MATTAGLSQVLKWATGTVTGQRPIVDGRVMRHLRRRFNLAFGILHLVDTPDLQGGARRTWAQTAVAQGAMEELSAEERLARGVTEAVGMFTVYMEFRADVDVRSRLQLGARIFEVKNVSDLGQQHLILSLDVSERFKP